MKPRYLFTSLTRISDLPQLPFSVEPLSRTKWETGDYVVEKVASSPNRFSQVELSSGRMVEVVEEDLLVGAFGVRYATLETVGGWQGIGHDRMMEALTGAGSSGRPHRGPPSSPRLSPSFTRVTCLSGRSLAPGALQRCGRHRGGRAERKMHGALCFRSLCRHRGRHSLRQEA